MPLRTLDFESSASAIPPLWLRCELLATLAQRQSLCQGRDSVNPGLEDMLGGKGEENSSTKVVAAAYTLRNVSVPTLRDRIVSDLSVVQNIAASGV